MEDNAAAREGKERFKRFLKVFEDIAATSRAQADMAAALLNSINHPQDGLLAALDDLREEVRGLREDLRRVAKGQGADGLLEALFGARRRGR